MKNIEFLLPNLSAGGAERVTITIARILRNEGYQVGFINFGSNEGEMLDWIVPEFNLISFGETRTLSALPKLIKFMRAHPDATYFSSREHVNVISLLAGKITGCKSVVRIPNMPRNVLTKGVSGLKMKIIKSINRRLLKNAKLIIAQNEEMKTQLEDFYKLPSELIQAINNPVDKNYVVQQALNSESPFRKDEISFVNVCNIAYSKGIDILIEAWPIVKRALPNAHMYLVGRKTSEFAVEMQRLASNLEDFTFVGFQTNPYPYLKHCDVFVLPSRMEGFPNVVLEAMCFNKPIVSTNCVQIIEDIVKPDENGYYCSIEDPVELANCMIKASKLKDINVTYDLFNKEALLNCFR